MGIDAAEAIRFADFLDHGAGLCQPRTESVLPSDELAAPPQTPVTGPQATGAEYPVLAPGTWTRSGPDWVGEEIARWDISGQPRRYHR